MTGTRTRLLVLASLIALGPWALAGCGGGSGDGGDTAPQPATSAASAGGSTGSATAGEAVWADAGCGGCHTLAAANSEGSVGPDLDDLQPSFEATVEQVTNGGGGMPAFADQLSEQQILDVSAYVVESTAGG